MKDQKKLIESILHNYTTMQREVQVLEYELNSITTDLRSEIIEGMVFARSNRERVSGCHISDKTANIAIEHLDSQINGEYHALRTLISNMRIELHRIDYYLSLIPEKEAEVIRMFYFEELTWSKITEKSNNSQSTMQRLKNKAIEKLMKYYRVLDMLDAAELDIRTKVRFIGYIHEERFKQCLGLVKKNATPGTEAMLYIISGCNELWQVGVEKFYNFESGTTINYTKIKQPFSDNGEKLLKLSYYLADSFNRNNLLHVLQLFFPELEYVHLELGIEAVKLTLFPGKYAKLKVTKN